MPSKPPTTAAAHRNSAQLTASVDLTNYTEDTSSDRNATWGADADSPHSIPARVDLRNTPRVIDTVRESGDAEVDARIYVPDDASGVSSIRDGGGKGASVVAYDGTDYRVLVAFDEDGGLLRLDCERVD